MKLIIIDNVGRTRIGRWFMEGYPAKFHALFWVGFLTFHGPRPRYGNWLLKHELIHYQQAKREGWFLWNIRYYWHLWRVGYRNNPYEIEAYSNQHYPLTAAERALAGVAE